jgi:TRAP-type mannitol/chloroaromatic compound transport system permease small subunit
MKTLLRISDALDRFVVGIGRFAAWSFVLLVVVIMFDVITRRFLSMGSVKLQEMEWYLHALLFLMCLGLGYVHNTHVRIEILSERFSERTRCWIEVAGCLLFLIPFCLLVIYYGGELTQRSWAKGEVSASATGLPYRWLIKAAVPAGMSVLLVGAVSVLMRRIVMLVRPDLVPPPPPPHPETAVMAPGSPVGSE